MYVKLSMFIKRVLFLFVIHEKTCGLKTPLPKLHIAVSSEFMGKALQAAQLTHDREIFDHRSLLQNIF
jgi:hypothetical protein